ncbi:hypothetical protein [Mangrovibacillus cuniculi]|uniref:Uncharacterized protein n=1 Tax=Mangrovibacillus cuniculi TaxID=2593652 RepID=A0A7S8HGQ7_9BACI|nr:hypothetical protein [Mangrovibacillus cuniculi]QPC48244.1 hypothetical protein G8O30_15620 [Mangrovibacillus cuniculi]
MGCYHDFDCKKEALPEIKEKLMDAKCEYEFVVLLGANKNILGFGKVKKVHDATADLRLKLNHRQLMSIANPQMAHAAQNSVSCRDGIELDFTVNLCCVCSVIAVEKDADDLIALLITLIFLGYTNVGFNFEKEID